MTGQTELAVAATSVSGRTLGQLPGLCAALGAVKAAAALANADAGVLDRPVADAVAAAARGLADPSVAPLLVVDPCGGGGGIGVHQNVNEVLARRAGATVAQVGASQSTADVCHTAARLAIWHAAGDLDAALADLQDALERAAVRFGDAPTLARTCLQDALAVPASLLPAGAAAAVARRRAALAAATEPLMQVVLGSTVVGTGAGSTDAYRSAVMGRLTEASGVAVTAHAEPASALQHGDDLLDVSSAVHHAAVVTAKVAQDLRLLSSGPVGGLGEVRLPKVMEGSSFFLAKNNPVVPESAIQAASLVAGHDVAARAAVGRAELHLAGYDLTAAVAVLDGCAVLARAARLLATTVAGMELHEQRCAELAAAATAHKEPT